MDANVIITILTTLGGFEGIKWVITYISTRKTNKRKDEASVVSLEITNKQQQVDWLEKRLYERDQKVDALYIELRQEQEKNIVLINENNNLKLEKKEAEVKRCDVRGCQQRRPPSEY